MNVKKNILRLALTTTLAAGALVLHDSPAAASGLPGWSWNLSRDLLVDVGTGNTLVSNPLNNAWTFLDSGFGQLKAVLPTGVCWGGVPDITCWEDLTTGYRDSAMVGVSLKDVGTLACPSVIPLIKGVPIMHPGPGSDAIVRWTNPFNHPLNIQILGRFTVIDPCGQGDGVAWSISDQNGTLASGALSDAFTVPYDTDLFYIVTTVNAGDTIDFVVNNGGNNDYYYDGTELDVLIVGQ